MVDLEAWWMVEVEIDSIRVSLMSQQRIVILKERNSERFLPIWIGPYEAINGREISIDSRPSDALALAVRAHVPVFIAEDVMNEAASIPEENIEGEEIEGEPDERLDVFKDFVDTLNLDDLETTEDDDKE
jgi:bifunctional DNase/RNase